MQDKLTIQQVFDLAVKSHNAGRLREAEQFYRQILARQPQHMGALHYLGVIAYQVGRAADGIPLIRQAIALWPDNAEAYCNLGVALRDNGQIDEAVAAYRQTIALNPNYAEAYNNLGVALKDKGRFDEAIALTRRSIALSPNYAEAHNNLGIVLTEKGDLEQAIAACRRAIALNPNYAQAYSNLGASLKENQQFDEAIAACRKAIALNPNLAEAYNNLGNALKYNEQLEEAIMAYQKAIAVKPNFPDAHNNLGVAFRDVRRFDEAIAACRAAIALKPDFPNAHLNLSFALLTQGDFEHGWDEYEWRWQTADFDSCKRDFSQPQWDGSPLQERTLLLHGEQGFGDTLQAFRYLSLVAAKGGRIIVECTAELLRLFLTSARGNQVVVRGQPLPTFDVHSPLLSLPRLFGKTLESIPTNVPYVFPDPQLVDAWRKKLTATPAEGLKVALAWAGNPKFKDDRTRSMTLDHLAPLAHVQGVTFYSVQKGDPAQHAENPPAGMRLVNLSPEIKDFADTAAVMSLMDVVLTTDTSVPHLAGALGRPVWVMLQFATDWRWLLEREDSPWYPSMRLFRQPRRGAWDDVIDRVVKALALLADSRAIDAVPL